MKRNALAVAVGALFVAPAAHAQITFGNEQIGTMQIYGKLYPQYGYFSSKNSTQPGAAVATFSGGGIGTVASPLTNTVAAGPRVEEPLPRASVDVGNSYIGFRGERGLGNWFGSSLKGIWQIEQSTAFDVGTGTWASRDSFVGLSSGGMGTVRLGNMDTVYKSYGDQMSMFGIASGNFVSASNVLSNSIGSNRLGRFHERRTNSIMYETPNFMGVTAGVMYGPDEAKTAARNAALWSYGIKYDSERMYVSVHQEKHQDFFGLSNNIANANLRNNGNNQSHSMDTATRFSAEFRITNARLVFDVARLEYNEYAQLLSAATPVKMAHYQHTNSAIGVDAGFGPWRYAAQYIVAGAGNCTMTSGSCVTQGLLTKQYNAGVRYRFDRQTFVYAIYSKLNNGASAAYNNNSNIALNMGSDTENFAIGVSYTF